VPQALQKALPAGFSRPQFGQLAARLAPQELQKALPGGFICPQRSHRSPSSATQATSLSQKA
jgi:hypothetical protein